MRSDASKTNSATKSRSETASMLLAVTARNPSSFAVYFRSRGRLVPASAAEPSGITLTRSRHSPSLCASRSSISRKASR